MDKKEFDSQYALAVAREQLASATEPRALRASYDRATHALVIELRNHVEVRIPCTLIQGLSGAAPEAVGRVKLVAQGADLHWDDLDVQFTVAGLLSGIFGTRAWMAELGRKGGAAISQKKAAASRANGTRGGRPRKIAG